VEPAFADDQRPTTNDQQMILLATDTSGNNGSIALARAASESATELEILDVVPLEGGTFSAQLVPQISDLLKRYKITKNDIVAFAVVSGPGSFTGLRVGLAAIKALAEILQKPIAAVSRLEAVVRSGSRPNVVAVIDAGRGEFYVGEYEFGEHPRMLGEHLLSREELLSNFRDNPIVTPDAGIAHAAQQAGLIADKIPDPRADVIARIGWEKIRLHETIAPEDLEANYIRRSDAEILAKRS
jgi:tRNA threonylcarbamoyladenosine biosynthesis protein TsaB